MKRYSWLILCCLMVCTPTWAVEQMTITPGKIIKHIPSKMDPNLKFAVYLPKTYTSTKKYALCLVSEPGARAALPLDLYKDVADRYDLILVASHNSRNFNNWEQNAKALAGMWADTVAYFSVDEDRVYAVGFSGGARRSTLLAIYTKQNIAGVVAHGAGFAGEYRMSPENPFPFVGLVGNRDFNYLEMLETKRELTKGGFTNRLIIFEGPHQWAPPEDFEEAMGWLFVLAHRNGKLPLEALHVEDQVNLRRSRADALYDKGDLFHAAAKYKALLEDFGDLADLSSTKTRLDTIEADKSYKKIMRGQKRAESNEKVHFGRLNRQLLRAKDNRDHEAKFLNNEMKWWRKEIKALQRDRDQTKDPLLADSAARILSHFLGICNERSVKYLREENWRYVVYMNRLAKIIKPKRWFHHINLARAYAQKKEKKKALNELEQIAGFGYKRFALIEDDALFDPIKADPKFKEIIAKMKENAKKDG